MRHIDSPLSRLNTLTWKLPFSFWEPVSKARNFQTSGMLYHSTKWRFDCFNDLCFANIFISAVFFYIIIRWLNHHLITFKQVETHLFIHLELRNPNPSLYKLNVYLHTSRGICHAIEKLTPTWKRQLNSSSLTSQCCRRWLGQIKELARLTLPADRECSLRACS